MGAPRLSIRRKSSKTADAPTPNSTSGDTPNPQRSKSPIISIPKRFSYGRSFSSSSSNAKNVRSESVETTNTVSSISEQPIEIIDGKCSTLEQNSQQQNNNASSNTKQKRSMRLNISPDEEGSESIQVMLSEGSPIKLKKDGGSSSTTSSPCNATEDDCIYTVGSVDYLVRDAAVKPKLLEPKPLGVDDIVEGIDDVKLLDESSQVNAPDNMQEEVTSAEGGGSEKKKSRMGSLFKKGGKKQQDDSGSGGGDGGDKEQGSSNNNSNDGDGNKKGDDSGDNSKDDDNNEEKKDGDSNNKGTSPSETTFTTERIQFAIDSTLPIHTGPESTAPTDHPSWTPVDGTEFKVRHGPNYPKTGRKEPSLAGLYEVYSVRFFRSGKRTVGGATRIMPLPTETDEDRNVNAVNGANNEKVEDTATTTTSSATGKGADEVATGNEVNGDANEAAADAAVSGGEHYPELNGTKIPDVLVVHFMLPYEPPNMFKQKDDGPGGECVYYLKPSQRFLDEISGRIPTTPATQLFAKWCAECQSDFKMRSRFKCMGLVREIEKHNFGLLKSYNGKPVLITESGRVCSGSHGDVQYLEMTANVHYWAFMAKKGFVSIIPKFAKMQIEVGFTIEAHTDSEMPECMLGSTVLSYISETTGPVVSPEMQEPVHEHQS